MITLELEMIIHICCLQ